METAPPSTKPGEALLALCTEPALWETGKKDAARERIEPSGLLRLEITLKHI